MDCTRFADLVESLLDPELDDGRALRERDAAREHGARCAACRARLEATRLVFMHLNTMVREVAPVDLSLRVLSHWNARLAARGRRRRQRLAALALLAAASVAIVVAALVWKDASAAWLWGMLGRMATWWYSWLRDLAGVSTRLLAVDVPLVAAALLRSARLGLEACVAPMLAMWLVATATGVVMHRCTGARRARRLCA